ncbi:MAG: GAF domain-containing protein [Kouleothrix sp.]|nr:GAF domain-containing protein [Kouleothrix sp.]
MTIEDDLEGEPGAGPPPPQGPSTAAQAGLQDQRGLAFLAEASALIGSSLDYEATLSNVARLAVPTIADQCVVDIVRPDGAVRRLIAVAGAAVTVGREIERHYPVDQASPIPAMHVIASGRSQLLPEMPDDEGSAARGSESLELMRKMNVQSAMIVPLVARGRMLGALSLGITTSGRRYDPNDLVLAEELARRAALAIDNARLYEAEQHARAAAEAAADRTARLQSVTAALAESLTPGQAAQVVVEQSAAALEASAGLVSLLSPDGAGLEVIASVGYEAKLLESWRRFPISAAVPLTDSVRSGEVVLVETSEDRTSRYPRLAAVATQHRAWASLPLIVDGRVIGGMGLSFAEQRRFSAPERDFMLALARQCAQALDRARLYEAERAARAAVEAAQARLAFLAEASTALISSLDYQTTLSTVARLAVPVLADWCVIDVIDADGAIRRVAGSHADPDKRALLQRLLSYPPTRAGASPVVQALRSGKLAVAAEVPDSMLVASAYDDEHLRIVRELAPAAFLIVPLRAREHVLGAMTLAVAESDWRYGPADVALAEELARRAAVAIDNARLYSEARSAVRARDDLLSIVSHDLQNPLQVIKSQAELLLRRAARAGTLDVEQATAGLVRINGETTKMNRLIGELLDLARLQVAQALDLDRQPIDLVALARRVAAERQQSTSLHAILVEAAAPELICHVDGVRLERLLDNLLSNAIKYSPGGGEVVVAVARERDGGDWAVLTVRDRGMGIPADDLPRIFDRFHRGGNVAGKIGGTGIGLASARQIVVQHGGTISVASVEGQGSTFTVRLPLAAGG